MSNYTKLELLAKQLNNQEALTVLEIINTRIRDGCQCLVDAVEDDDVVERCNSYYECGGCEACLRDWIAEDSGVPNPWDDILIF